LQVTAPGSIFGHESGMAPVGRTFYPASIATGQLTAVDISNPRLPLPLWQGNYNSHGLTIGDDGNRAYVAAIEGLIVLDISDIQARKPNPQVREISRLSWSTMTIPQNAIPVTIKGKPYVVEVDEFSQNPGQGGGAQSVAANGAKVGAARIIDISDERHPFVVSDLRLAVHQPENRAAIANDPGAQSPVQGYAAHYCNVPQRHDPGIVACSMILSGLRVFDIRDPYHPKEIAYFVAPPSTISATGSPVIDERSNWAMSQPAFAPERGEIWYSDGNSGFYALRMDPKVWPFPSTSSQCNDALGFVSAAAHAAGRSVRLSFVRRARLPVRIDVFRVSQGRRVIHERRVAHFDSVTRAVTFKGTRGAAGIYFARLRMLKSGRAYDTRRVVFAQDASGRLHVRPTHYRRDSCGLLAKFKLERPAFGGSTRTPLAGAYRLTGAGKVTITISRGKRFVKRLATTQRAADHTFRFSVAAARLPRGDYTVRLLAQSGEEQAVATLAARRL
jgi:hypothetical protein